MKFLALISGGKDSFFSIHHCLSQGHELVALGNLYPQDKHRDEIDSYMFQTVGHDVIDYYKECLDVPLYRQAIIGESKNQDLEYSKTENDEIEDLHQLISTVKQHHPDIEAVSCGAILSHYQRTRVENICDRFQLTSLAWLWQRDQGQLMEEMCDSGLDARIIKVAAIGLNETHLGKSIKELYPYLVKLNQMYEVHVCGEGGEFETLVLDSKFFKKRLVIDEKEIITGDSDVSYMKMVLKVAEKEKEDLFQNVSCPPLLDDSFQEIYDEVQGESYDIDYEEDSVPPFQLSHNVTKVVNNLYVSNLADKSATMSQKMAGIFIKLEDILLQFDLNFNDIQHITLLLSDMSLFNEVNQIYQQKFSHSYLPPSRVCIQTKVPSMIQLSCKCIISETNTKKGIHIRSRSFWGPQNIGPYSQSRIEEQTKGNFATISGQIPLVPATMELSNGENEKLAVILSLQHFTRVKRLINVNEISYVMCFVTEKTNLKLVEEVWEKFSQVDETENVANKLIILKVQKLPKDASIEWGGETFRKIEDFLEEDEEEEKINANEMIQVIKKFNNITINTFSNMVQAIMFTNDTEEVRKLYQIAFNHSDIKIGCNYYHAKTLGDIPFEHIPSEYVLDHTLQKFNYCITLTMEISIQTV